MKPWLLVLVAVGGLCMMCSGGVLVLGLLADDESSGGARTLGVGCPDTVDGWQRSITPRALVLTKGDVTAELSWTFEYTDALRQGESEGSLWRAVLGDRYEPGPLERTGPGGTRLAGPATERASGRTVYVAFTSGALNGFASAVAVIGPDASILAAFPDAASLNALSGLNRFPLSCGEVEGQWTSGFNTVAERYAAGTGRFVGVEAVAAWRDLTLESGAYRRESSALLNGVFNKRVDSGSWTHDDWSLVLEPDGLEAIAFDASLIAVSGGFVLRLANRKFPADIEEFGRVE